MKSSTRPNYLIMNKLFVLTLLVLTSGINFCKAQDPFKNKAWYCFKTVNHGELAANKRNGDSHGINKSTVPEFKFYYDFSNHEGEGGQHFTYYNGHGGYEYQGIWSYKGQTLYISSRDHSLMKYTVVIFSDPNFLIIKDGFGMWYYLGNGN